VRPSRNGRTSDNSFRRRRGDERQRVQLIRALRHLAKRAWLQSSFPRQRRDVTLAWGNAPGCPPQKIRSAESAIHLRVAAGPSDSRPKAGGETRLASIISPAPKAQLTLAWGNAPGCPPQKIRSAEGAIHLRIAAGPSDFALSAPGRGTFRDLGRCPRLELKRAFGARALQACAPAGTDAAATIHSAAEAESDSAAVTSLNLPNFRNLS